MVNKFKNITNLKKISNSKFGVVCDSSKLYICDHLFNCTVYTFDNIYDFIYITSYTHDYILERYNYSSFRLNNGISANGNYNTVRIEYFLNENNKKIFSYDNNLDESYSSFALFNNVFKHADKIIHGVPIRFELYNTKLNMLDLTVDAGGITKMVFFELSKFLMSDDTHNKFLELDTISNLYNLKQHKKPDQMTIAHAQFVGSLFKYAMLNNVLFPIKLDPILIHVIIFSHNFLKNCRYDKIKHIVNLYDSTLLNNSEYICFTKNRTKYRFCDILKSEINSKLSNENNTYELADMANLDDHSMNIIYCMRIVKKHYNNRIIIKTFINGFSGHINEESLFSNMILIY